MDVVTDVESEEPFADDFLTVQNPCVDRLDDNCQHLRMFEFEILVFNFTLGCELKTRLDVLEKMYLLKEKSFL